MRARRKQFSGIVLAIILVLRRSGGVVVMSACSGAGRTRMYTASTILGDWDFCMYIHQHTVIHTEQNMTSNMRGQVALPNTSQDAGSLELNMLHDRLDSLWVQYLHFLDEYTTAQASIKKHMSSGFFSLAQANSNSAGSGRRYGRDYYDDRTSATTKAEVHIEDGGSGAHISIVKAEVVTAEEDFELPVAEKADAVDSLPTPEATPEPENKSKAASDMEKEASDMEEEASDMEEKTKSRSATASTLDLHDPLRWFGILIPPTLRHAQRSFVSAVLDEDTLARSVNAARGMRQLEVEIRKLRKAIRKMEKS